MKKITKQGLACPILFKISLKMKFATLLLVVSLFEMHASGYSQNVRISMNLKNVSVETVLKEVESKTDYRFIYSNKEIDLYRKISFNVKKETVKEILKQLFKDTKIGFELYENRHIILTLKDQKNQGVLPNKQTGLYYMQVPRNISGKVINEQGQPVEGANVKAKGGSFSTQTDAEGNFTIKVTDDISALIVSFIGMESQEVKITGSDLVVILQQQGQKMDEVVIIGYGTTKKKDGTGAFTTVKPDALNKGLQATVLDALVGKVSGVNIIPGSGAPGSAGVIRIRMGASLSANNDPLVVIDGVPVESATLSFINPNDIDTYTVLKDASATAIYGSRASNGVVIITTKKGSKNGGMRIAYNSNFTQSEVQGYYKNLSGDQYREAFSNYAFGVPAGYKPGESSTDWQKQVYRTAFGMDHNLSFTGAIKEIPYRLSGGYLNQEGVLKENKYERYTVGVGLSPKFLDKHLSVDLNVKASSENENPASTGEIGGAISFDPTRPVYADYPDQMGLGYYMWLDANGKPIPLSPTNPVSNLFLTDKVNKTKRSIGNVVLDYKIHGFEDLHLNLNLGYDVFKKNYSEVTPDKAPSMYTSNNNDGTGKEYQREDNNKNFIFSSYANYTKDITAKHNINAMAGYEWQKFAYENHDQTLKGYPAPPYQDEDQLYLLSFFGRVNYSFDQKLLVTATLRADGSSRFAPENQWGYFPSVALGYKLSEESLFKGFQSLSNLKLRLSYGQTGQQDIGGYHPYLSTYTVSQDQARYQFGSDWVNMYRPNGYDPNIKWETTTTYNIGLDYGFFNNRVSGTIDVYKRYTSDLLNNIAVPAGSNFTNLIQTNIGNMKGSGMEFGLNLVPVKNENLEWTFSGNFTYSVSEITKLNIIDREDSYVKTGSVTRSDFQINKVGELPNTFFLLRQAYDENGKPLDGQYIAKDGSITTSMADTNKYITGKSSRTPYYYGLSTRLLYKNWDFGINGHGSFGNYVFNYQEAQQSLSSLYGASGISSNISQAALDKGFTQVQIFSDIYLENGAFFKFDNITAGYTLDKISKALKSLRLAFSMQNIATITRYKGLDPEIYNGLDNNTYQRPRIYTISLNANF